MAINNAAVVVEPQAFIALDAAKCFNYNIFNNPRVTKFLSYSRHSDIVGDMKLCQYPNTFFFDLAEKSATMMSEFCSVEGPLPYWQNTFFTAIACLYQLGIREIYMIGCVFDTGVGSYAHDQINSNLTSRNQRVYDDSVEKLGVLLPILRDEGMIIKTCHKDTPLKEICDYIRFEDAISKIVLENTSIGIGPMLHASEVK